MTLLARPLNDHRWKPFRDCHGGIELSRFIFPGSTRRAASNARDCGIHNENFHVLGVTRVCLGDSRKLAKTSPNVVASVSCVRTLLLWDTP